MDTSISSLVSQAREQLAHYLATRPTLSTYDAVLDYAALHPVETFHVLYLNKKNNLIHHEHHATGVVDHVPVYPRTIIHNALNHNASAIILVHNHPSGDPTPSQADKDMTNFIHQACDLLGIALHDHIIATPRTNYSFRANGLLS